MNYPKAPETNASETEWQDWSDRHSAILRKKEKARYKALPTPVRRLQSIMDQRHSRGIILSAHYPWNPLKGKFKDTLTICWDGFYVMCFKIASFNEGGRLQCLDKHVVTGADFIVPEMVDPEKVKNPHLMAIEVGSTITFQQLEEILWKEIAIGYQENNVTKDDWPSPLINPE